VRTGAFSSGRVRAIPSKLLSRLDRVMVPGKKNRPHRAAGFLITDEGD
jgi:hypothetical protein